MRCIVLVSFLLSIGGGLAEEVVSPPKLAQPQEGVFILANMFSSTVLELKDGHFRYWFESDVGLGNRRYPLTGDYSIHGDTIVLDNAAIFEKQWSFRTFREHLTLWRPSAIDGYERKKAV